MGCIYSYSSCVWNNGRYRSYWVKISSLCFYRCRTICVRTIM
nr:MAG TPA: hypothetical protein [Bacteriophage sp.]